MAAGARHLPINVAVRKLRFTAEDWSKFFLKREPSLCFDSLLVRRKFLFWRSKTAVRGLGEAQPLVSPL
jgi:hypothetical protein